MYHTLDTQKFMKPLFGHPVSKYRLRPWGPVEFFLIGPKLLSGTFTCPGPNLLLSKNTKVNPCLLCDVNETKAIFYLAVSEDDLDDLSSKIKMGFDQFLSETLQALTRTNMGNLNFQYSMKKSKDGAQFTWKKYIPKEDIRVSELSSLTWSDCVVINDNINKSRNQHLKHFKSPAGLVTVLN